METNKNINNDLPTLFVDMDGCLIKTDMLYESFFALLKSNFLHCLLIPFWLLRGKAYMKEMISQRVNLDVESLPYNNKLIDFLKTEKNNGRTLILATASNHILAKKISEYLGLFTDVISSSIDENISGKRKLKKIQAITNGQPFEYAANAMIDIHIWKHAEAAILVNPDRNVEKSARLVTTIKHIFDERNTRLLRYIKAIRVYQWMKNLLIFVPLFTAHQFTNIPLIINGIIAFAAFSLCASGVYVLNDLLDLPADREHPRKRLRPFASGDIKLSHGILLACLLPAIGLGLALFLSPDFFGILFLYLFMTTAYSVKFKAHAIIDVLLLAGLYTIRIFAGAIAIDVVLSFWLLTFSMFIFLSLALVKRCSELIMLSNANRKESSGRGYHISDLDLLKMMGVSSGYLSILIVALYIDNPTVTQQYSHPQLLWLLCPVLLLWISRVWLKTVRSEMHDDPLVFAIKDKVSHAVIFISGLIVLLAI